MKHMVWRTGIAKRSLAILSMLALLAVVSACGGSTPTSTPQPPAAAKNLILAMDTIQGSANMPDDAKYKAAWSCVQTNRIPKNGQVVFRVRVYDPKTGDLMDDKSLSGIQIKLANGTTIDAKYGAHPKGGTEFFWTGSWIVPATTPTGTLNYTLTATSTDGRTGQWTPISVATTTLQVTDEVLPVKQQ